MLEQSKSERVDPICTLPVRSPLTHCPEASGPLLLGFKAGASVIRRTAFLEMGGFQSRMFVRGEEDSLALDLASAGWALTYIDDMIVHHYPSHHRSDITARRRAVLHNRLWVAWLRRPRRHVLLRTLAMLGQGLRDPAAHEALVAAARELPWVLRSRRVVQPHIEEQIRLLEHKAMRQV